MLRLVGALSMLSVVVTLMYTVFEATSVTGFLHGAERRMLYIAPLQFVLPFLVLYTINTNSWLSRPLVPLYKLVLFGATILGYGVLGAIDINEILRLVFASAFLLVVFLWLY